MTIASARIAALVPVALALVVVTVVVPGQGAAAADLVTIAGSATRALPYEDDQTVTFPITLPDPAVTEIGAQVTDITLVDTPVPTTSLTAEVQPAASTLTITVADAAAFTAAGDYTVTLLLSAAPKPPATARTTQLLSLTLKRQAAALAPGSTVEVIQYDGWMPLPFLIPPDVHPEVNLAVGPGGTLLSVSAAQQETSQGQLALTAACADGEACDLSAGPPHLLADPVPPSGRLHLDYEPEGFPLGTTTRTVEIRSPQFTAPVSVTFTVSQRLVPAWIVIITLLGLLAGLLVRVVLGGIISWADRRTAASELERIIAGLRAQYPEESELQSALTPITQKLTARAVTVETVKELTADVGTALDALRARWQQRLDAQTAVSETFAQTWTVPERFRSSLAAVRLSLLAEQQAIRSFDTAAWTAAVQDRRSAARDLSADLSGWSVRFTEALGQVKKAIEASSLPAAVSARAAIDEAVRAPDAPAAPVAGSPAVAAADGAAEAEQGAQPVDADAAAALAALTRVEALDRAWRDGIRPDLLSVVEELGARSRPLETRANAALVNADPALAAREVAGLLTDLLAIPEPSTQKERGDVSVVTTPEATPIPVLLPRFPLPPMAQVGFSGRRLGFTAVGVGARILRWVILAAIVCVAVYFASIGEWVGTPPQVIAIFGWAFALDVTVQGVTAMFTSSGGLPVLTASAVTPAGGGGGAGGGGAGGGGGGGGGAVPADAPAKGEAAVAPVAPPTGDVEPE